MLEASKVALLRLRKWIPTIASLAVFLLVVGIARGADWKAALGRLVPLGALLLVAFIYQIVKARRIMKGKPQLSRGQLFSRFYLAVGLLFFAYFGISILWELKGNGDEGFAMLLPVFLFCGALCGVALYKELGDLEDDFGANG
ncbi:hypothetical protein C7402_10834 [Paraburkholderia unamae]|uniref:Membrane protein DUF2178 n=2 Tax=Paraburkholderia unamae TaxID=219649 RepID=A0ABX5KKX4_9BURK|nr:hypothetical protein C7402_10834 [Paraburkholderia unamae]CAG9267572.1 conserved membrane hypothetical protein [Paraburkholderia unamae]